MNLKTILKDPLTGRFLEVAGIAGIVASVNEYPLLFLPSAFAYFAGRHINDKILSERIKYEQSKELSDKLKGS